MNKNNIINKLFKKKIGLTPVLVVVLLVVITIVFVIILLNWGTSFTKQEIDPIDFQKTYETCDYALNITVNSSSNNRIVVRSSYDETLTINGYYISSNKFPGGINEYIELDAPITLDKGQSKSF